MDTIKQARKLKKEAVKITKLQEHEATLVEDLFTSNDLEVPKILYGNVAEDFVKENAIDGESLLKKKPNGLFVRDFEEGSKVSDKDRRTGVVCMFKVRVATLAHELRHSYQWQTDKSLFPNTIEEREKYKNDSKKWNKKDYYNTPVEKDAFTYAMQYLNTHTGSLNGFYLRWMYRLNILGVKSFVPTLIMFVLTFVFFALFDSVVSEISFISHLTMFEGFEGFVGYLVGYMIVVLILLDVICRVLLDREHFQKLK